MAPVTDDEYTFTDVQILRVTPIPGARPVIDWAPSARRILLSTLDHHHADMWFGQMNSDELGSVTQPLTQGNGKIFFYHNLTCVLTSSNQLTVLYNRYNTVANAHSPVLSSSWVPPSWEIYNDIIDFACTWNTQCYAAITTDGRVITDSNVGAAGPMLQSVERVVATANAFAALTKGGRVVTWGDAASGGDSSAVADALVDVVDIVATNAVFAAVTKGGRVVVWGHARYGGSGAGPLLGSQERVVATYGAFAALSDWRHVMTWGDSECGGDSSAVAGELGNVVDVVATNSAFAALKDGGQVVTWGFRWTGGDSSEVADALAGGVKRVVASNGAFAALKEDGHVVTWGEAVCGGDSYRVQASLRSVSQVVSIRDGFVAVADEGKQIVTWRGGVTEGVYRVSNPNERVVAVEAVPFNYEGFVIVIVEDGRPRVVRLGSLTRVPPPPPAAGPAGPAGALLRLRL